MENRRKGNARFAVAVILAALVVCTAASGITYAYLSADPGTAVNVITVGEIAIELEEKSWDRNTAQDLHPKETAAKDPVVINTGSNPAYVFLEVVVPMRDFCAVSEEGIKEASKVQQLFQYEPDLTAWELIEETVKGGKMVSVYGYRGILDPGNATVPLFTEVSAANYLEGSVDAAEVFTIDITAKAIQDRLETSQQSLAEIYSEFVRQTETDSVRISEKSNSSEGDGSS